MINVNPADVIVVLDNIEAIKILTDAGMLSGIAIVPPFNAAFAVFPTATHYCMAEKHINHPDPTDNGYAVLMLPKDKIPLEEAAQFIREYADMAFPGQRQVTEFSVALSSN